MAKFKITATVMTTVVKEIEAPTKEEAERIFYDDTYQNIVEDADEVYITDINTDYVETTSIDYEVHITEIEYDWTKKMTTQTYPKNSLSGWNQTETKTMTISILNSTISSVTPSRAKSGGQSKTSDIKSYHPSNQSGKENPVNKPPLRKGNTATKLKFIGGKMYEKLQQNV